MSDINNTIDLKKSSSRKFGIAAAIATLGFGAGISAKLYKINNDEVYYNRSVLSEIIDLPGEYSEGFNHGAVLSIEGTPISTDVKYTYTSDSGKINSETRHCALPAFTPVIGVSGVNGLISACDDVLLSSAYKSNRVNRTGNDIHTTISYNGQKTASDLLDTYFPQSVCKSATVSVVLEDGAVLVAAGNNSYTYTDTDTVKETDVFDFDNTPKDFSIDFTTENIAVGSVAKVLTGRALILNDSKLSKDDSVYNEHYKDLSFCIVDSHKISNWDYTDCYAYPEAEPGPDGLRSRNVSFSEALIHSSNTYFLRHVQSFGFQNTFDEMDRIYQLSSSVETEIYTLPGIEMGRQEYFFWGQDFKTNPIRLCSMYNTALSSKAYVPFYVASVNTPDNELLYKASPSLIKDISFDIPKDDILKKALSDCFKSYSHNISPDIIDKYSDMIESNRLLAKSGTAEIDVDNGINNNTRVLTVLDKNMNVVATSCILIERAGPDCIVNDNILFTILFRTLEDSGVL